MMNGKGKYYFKNGDIFEGNWNDDKPNGIFNCYIKTKDSWIEKKFVNGIEDKNN